MNDQAHLPNRRHTDVVDLTEKAELDASFKQCPAYVNHSDVAVIHGDLQEIKKTVEEMRDIIIAWQDAKAFFKMIKIIGEILKWMVATGAAIGIIWYFLSGRAPK